MRIDIITLFPEVFKPYLQSSILKRAQEKKIVEIFVHNLRDFTQDKHKTVDDAPFGGGAGMVLKIEPIVRAISKLKINDEKLLKILLKIKVIATSTRGKKFNQQKAYDFSKLDQLIIICGHYEAIDERVLKYFCDETISIGPYILTGGELPALIITDATVRLLDGVLGNKESLKEDFQTQNEGVSFPQYTRPAIFIAPDGKKLKVPKVLLSGDHEKIKKWRLKKMVKIK